MALSQSTNIEANETDDSESEKSSAVDQHAEMKRQENKTQTEHPHMIPQSYMTSRDLVNLEPKESNFKSMINALESKYSAHFKEALAAKENARTITIVFPRPVKNRNGVAMESLEISFDRVEKLYTITSMPDAFRDPLVDETTQYSAYQFRVCVHCKKLKNAFSRSISLLNKIYFCKACGRFAWSSDWSVDHEMCSKCMLEECLYFSSTKVHNCTICQQQGKRMYVTRCGHHFHRKCLTDYLLSNVNRDIPGKCPNCRTILDEDDESLEGDDH